MSKRTPKQVLSDQKLKDMKNPVSGPEGTPTAEYKHGVFFVNDQSCHGTPE